jgi:hypothetical protein
MNKDSQEYRDVLVFNKGKTVLIGQAISCILNSPLADDNKIYKQLQRADKIINEVNTALENKIKKLEKS